MVEHITALENLKLYTIYLAFQGKLWSFQLKDIQDSHKCAHSSGNVKRSECSSEEWWMN